MFRLLASILVLAAALSALPADAMDFSLLRTASGQTEVLASGEIIPGDAPRLARALRHATPDAHGTRRLLLDSPGSVVDAIDMADLMNQIGVITVVPAKAMCASACLPWSIAEGFSACCDSNWTARKRPSYGIRRTFSGRPLLL